MGRSETKAEVRVARLQPEDYGLPAQTIGRADYFTQAMSQARAMGANMLTAVSRCDHIPEDYRIAVKLLSFDSSFTPEQWENRSNGTFYVVDGGRLALHRGALDQIAEAVGLQWIPAECGRVDDGLKPHVWVWKMTAKVRRLDGEWVKISRTKELDFSDDSPAIHVWHRKRERLEKWSEARLRGAREHGAALAESKAANRVIRAALGIPGAYEQEAARQPFVMAKLVWAPNPDDPTVKALTAIRELELGDEVFGKGRGAEGLGRALFQAAIEAGEGQQRRRPEELAPPALVIDAKEAKSAPAGPGPAAAGPGASEVAEGDTGPWKCEACDDEITNVNTVKISRAKKGRDLCSSCREGAES